MASAYQLATAAFFGRYTLDRWVVGRRAFQAAFCVPFAIKADAKDAREEGLTVARLAQRLLSSLEDYFAQLNPNL